MYYNDIPSRKFDYISTYQFMENCEWVIDNLCNIDTYGNLITPAYHDEIYHLNPFQLGKFFNPIFYHNHITNNRVFCRIDCINALNLQLVQDKIKFYDKNIILYLGQSDIALDSRFLEIIECPPFKTIYTSNKAIEHEKVKCFPLGLRYEDESEAICFNNLRANMPKKDNICYVRFSVGTNPKERNKCLQYCGQPNSERTNSREEYLENIAKSYFMLIPKGNSDTMNNDIGNNQFLECAYLKTIPVTTSALSTDFWQKYGPMVILKDWSEFQPDMLTKDLYKSLYDKYPNSERDLSFKYYFNNYCE